MATIEVDKEEAGWLGIMRLNKLWGRKEIVRKWRFGRLSIDFSWRSRKNLWGRFGGGWNWELGFQASRWRSVAFMLLICRVYVYFQTKAEAEAERRNREGKG